METSALNPSKVIFPLPFVFTIIGVRNTATSVRWDQRTEEQLKTYASDGPSILSGALLLQFYDDVSDQEEAEHILYDLRWKVALHLPLDYAGFDASSLSRYISVI
jgi:hypothetical protein